MLRNVRVLVVAPDQPNVNSIPEIREISSKPNLQTTILNGPVTCQDVFRYCKDKQDVIHFVTHGEADGLMLSDGLMSAADIAQSARIAGASVVFFNSCDSAELAGYIVSHGVVWALQGNTRIEDSNAWKIMLAFYAGLDSIEPVAVIRAMQVAFDGTGTYGHTVSLDFLSDVLGSSRLSSVKLTTWQLLIIFAVVVMTIWIALLALW